MKALKRDFGLFFYLPPSLGAMSVASLLFIAGINAETITASLTVLGVSLGMGWWMPRHHAMLVQRATTSLLAPHAGLSQACLQVMPIWSRQIETVRDQTQDAVTKLCGRFSEIVSNLEAALAASKQTAGGQGAHGDGGILSVITACQEDLAEVMKILEATQRSRQDLVAEVVGFAKYTQDLQAMSEEVTNIAMQSNVVALNATIEAARLGEQGKSFAIVVGEMRNLSNLSRAVGNGMSKKIGVISAEILAKLESAKRFSEHDAQSGRVAKSAIDVVLARFHEVSSRLAESIAALQQESDGIHDQISDALVSLQYQDRVSQILTHVRQNIDEIHQQIHTSVSDTYAGKLPSVDDKQGSLDRMLLSYSTEEERRNHKETHAQWAQTSRVTYF